VQVQRDRLVHAHEEAAGVLDAAVRRHQRGAGEYDRERLRRIVQPAHRGPAGQALAQVRAQRDGLRRVGLAVDEGRQHRREPLALLPRLDPRVALEEALAPLRQAAVDLRVGPSGDLADLLVGVPQRPEPQRADLLRLEPVQRLGRSGHAVGREDAVLGRGRRARLERVEVHVGGADHPPPRAVERERLVLDHGVQPARRALRVQPRGVAHEDLQGPLVGVVGVVGA
jgi:hypothetical protein